MDEDTFERIRAIVVNHLGVEQSKVTLATSFVGDLDADSLDVLELLMSFEEAFSVVIPDNALETIVTVQDAADCIQRQCEPRLPNTPHP